MKQTNSKPNNQLRQMGQLEIKRNKRFPDQTIDSEINLSGNKKGAGQTKYRKIEY